MIEVEEITTVEGYNALGTVWEELLEQVGSTSPFFTHEWFGCCISAFGRDKELRVIVIKDSSCVIGAAPLWRRTETTRGIKTRKIEFISCPDTPFVDFIVKESRRRDALNAILEHLFTRDNGSWDVLALNQWPDKSANLAVFEDLVRGRARVLKGFSSRTPYIAIDGGWDEFFKSLSVRFRKSRRNILNRVNKLDGVEVLCVREDSDHSVMEDILSVSERSWKEKEGLALSSRDETRRFFRDLTMVAGSKGWLRVWLLKLNGLAVAIEYDIEYKGKVYALRADFDESYSNHSPGAYLELQIIKRLFEEGYSEYNTGPGLNDYKLNWTSLVRNNVALTICNDTLNGRLLWALEQRVLPILKMARKVLRKDR